MSKFTIKHKKAMPVIAFMVAVIMLLVPLSALACYESDPGNDDSGTDDPGTDDPGTDDPGTDDPGTDDPGTDDPGTDDPGTDDPGTDDPGTDDPGTDDPGTGTPGKPERPGRPDSPTDLDLGQPQVGEKELTVSPESPRTLPVTSGGSLFIMVYFGAFIVGSGFLLRLSKG
ncbi:MAG: hypothetical protein ACQESO_07715 [Bacillota bacterium]